MKCPICKKDNAKYLLRNRKLKHDKYGFSVGLEPRTDFRTICRKCGGVGEVKNGRRTKKN